MCNCCRYATLSRAQITNVKTKQLSAVVWLSVFEEVEFHRSFDMSSTEENGVMASEPKPVKCLDLRPSVLL